MEDTQKVSRIAALEEIRERYAARPGDVEGLLDAVDAVLEAVDDFQRDAGKYDEEARRIGSSLLAIRAQELEACAAKVREAITRTLAGP